MDIKKTLLIYLCFPVISFAQVNDYSNDYSKGNTNQYKKYIYKPKEQLDSADYFSENISTPKEVEKKYKNLFNNSASAKGCWDKAGKAYGIDPWLLLAVAKVESNFHEKAININKDKSKSTDIGTMQINTYWIPILKKYNIHKEDLLNPCTSVFVGAWIMAQNIARFGYNKDGIGAYNSPHNIKIRRNYANKVYKAYEEITNDLYYGKKK